MRQQSDTRTHGTVVVWRGLRRFDLPNISSEDASAQKRFYDEAARVRTHLGMVFGRLLRGSRLTMTVGGERIHAWDPFLTVHSAVQRLPFEELETASGTVQVEGFILPHPRRLTKAERESAAGPGGWLDQQGFYVYRRDRLIVAGDWLGLRGLRRDERFSLARIAVDVPAGLDMDWGLDVRKSSAVPPVGLRRSLERHRACCPPTRLRGTDPPRPRNSAHPWRGIPLRLAGRPPQWNGPLPGLCLGVAVGGGMLTDGAHHYAGITVTYLGN